MAVDLSHIAAVLYTPVIGDPHRLLAQGPCNLRPPTVCRWTCGSCEAVRWETCPRCRRVFTTHRVCPCSPFPARPVGVAPSSRSLVLAWEGKPLRFGCWLLGGLFKPFPGTVEPMEGWSMENAFTLAMMAPGQFGGQGIWIDTDGVEHGND